MAWLSNYHWQKQVFDLDITGQAFKRANVAPGNTVSISVGRAGGDIVERSIESTLIKLSTPSRITGIERGAACLQQDRAGRTAVEAQPVEHGVGVTDVSNTVEPALVGVLQIVAGRRNRCIWDAVGRRVVRTDGTAQIEYGAEAKQAA